MVFVGYAFFPFEDKEVDSQLASIRRGRSDVRENSTRSKA